MMRNLLKLAAVIALFTILGWPTAAAATGCTQDEYLQACEDAYIGTNQFCNSMCIFFGNINGGYANDGVCGFDQNNCFTGYTDWSCDCNPTVIG